MISKFTYVLLWCSSFSRFIYFQLNNRPKENDAPIYLLLTFDDIKVLILCFLSLFLFSFISFLSISFLHLHPIPSNLTFYIHRHVTVSDDDVVKYKMPSLQYGIMACRHHHMHHRWSDSAYFCHNRLLVTARRQTPWAMTRPPTSMRQFWNS